MIKELQAWLTTQLTGVRTWYEYGIANINASTPKPFGVIELGSLFPSVEGPGGFQEIRLTLVFARGSWVPVMEAAEELRRKLDGQVLTRVAGGERFRVEWTQTLEGVLDTALNAFVVTLLFSVPLRM